MTRLRPRLRLERLAGSSAAGGWRQQEGPPAAAVGGRVGLPRPSP